MVVGTNPPVTRECKFMVAAGAAHCEVVQAGQRQAAAARTARAGGIPGANMLLKAAASSA